MLDGLDDWRRLSALAEIGDMATAAERLGITRNALSKAIIRLEESCGVPLFERLPEGRVSPTPLGGEVLEDVRQMLQQSEVLQKKVDLARSAAAQDEAAGVKFSMRIPAPDSDRLDALLALLAKTQVDGFGLKVSKNDWFVRAVREKMDRDEGGRREFGVVLAKGGGAPPAGEAAPEVKFSMRIPAPDNARLDALLALLANTQVDGFGLKVSKNGWFVRAMREGMDRDEAALRDLCKGEAAEKT